MSVRMQSRNRWSVQRFIALTEIELMALFSEGRTLVSSLLLEPVVQLTLLAAGLQGLIGGGGDFYNGHNYLAFVLPGLIMLQALKGFSRTMYRTVLDRQWGMLTIKRLSGAGGAGYALSKIVAPVAALMVQFFVLVLLALAMGVMLEVENLLVGMLLAIIAVAFWASLAIIVTSFVRDYVMRDMVVSWMMLPLSLAAPVFYQIETAPAYLQWIARFNPLAWQVESLRSALLDGQMTYSMIVMAALSLVVIIAAISSVSHGDALVSEGGR